MLKKFIKIYYKLLDEKLENGTIVVLLIAALIVSVTFLTDDTNAGLLAKASIIEAGTQNNNIIEINGVKYKLLIEEIKK